MRLVFYVIVYGFLGFLLERIINMIAFGQWVDNSVLYGPVQPMYGAGVVMTLVFFNLLGHIKAPKSLKLAMLIIMAIVFTAMSELISGTLYEHFYGIRLWDYQQTFTLWCHQPYSCIIPTSIFGVLAALTVIFLHPFVKRITWLIPRVIIIIVIVLFLIDVFFTYKEVLF